MALRTILEDKLLFNAVRSGAFRTLREDDDYYANGFWPNASSLAADNATGYDADYNAGIVDVGGNLVHKGNIFVKRATAVPLNTLDVHTNFVEGGATAYETIALTDDGSYVLNITGAGYTEVTYTAFNLSNLGFPNLTSGLLYDGATVVTALNPNGSSVGAQLRWQFTVADVLNRISLYMSGAGHTCVYKVEASANKLQWVTLGTNFIPALAGWNHFDFVNTTAYKYYRLVLTGRTLATETTFCTEIKIYETDQCFLINGIEVYDLSKMNDANLVNTAFDTNGMPAGAYVGFKMSAAQKINKIGLYMDGAGYTSTFAIKGSNDMVAFTTLDTGFAPSAAGWNYVEFANTTAYKYYILELETDTAVETVTCAEFSAEYTGKYFTYSGLTAFDGGGLSDADTGTAAVDVNGAAAGSWFKLTFDTATILNKISFFLSDAAHTSTYKIQGSNDDAAWDDLDAAFAPVLAGWNASTFANATAYKYYRFYLVTNLPVETTTITELKLERQYISKYTSDVTSGKSGATCLGIIKNHDDVADYELTHDISLSTVDLSGVDRLYFWVWSTVAETGAATITVKQGLNVYTTTVDINAAVTVEEFYIDLSAVLDANKNAIDTIIVTVGGSSENKRIWFDGLIGGYYAVVEVEAPDMTPAGDYSIKVLRFDDTSAPPIDEGEIHVQVSGDGTVWEFPLDADTTETVTNMLVPASEYDLANGTGEFVKYTYSKIYTFNSTFVNDFGVATKTYIRILSSGNEVAIGAVIMEKDV